MELRLDHLVGATYSAVMSPPHPARSRGPIGGWLGLAAYGAVWAAFSVASAYITLAGVGREGFADVAIVAGFVLLAGVSHVLMGEKYGELSKASSAK